MAKEISVELLNLFDIYAPLLSEKKRVSFELYYFEDYSLKEISEQLECTRQAVLDNIKIAENKLIGYENKLGIYEKFTSYDNLINSIKYISSNNKKIQLLIDNFNQENGGE